jgi:hypothetical protein
MKVIGLITCLLTVTSSVGSLRGHSRHLDDQPVLFAQYDWEHSAMDVSASPVYHAGVLDDGVTAEDGTLSVYDGYGVDLGVMPELDGAKQARFEFKDVTFTDLPNYSQYSVLLGAGEWWVGVDFDSDGGTYLVFNVGGWGGNTDPRFDFDYRVKVSGKRVKSFKKIEYKFDGSEPSDSRLAIRYDDSDWIKGGWSTGPEDSPAHFFASFPTSYEKLHINDGWRSDWDDMNGSLGPVSLYALPPTHQYKAYEGVCRENADGTGMGSNGTEYIVHKRENIPELDYEWCKDECDASNDCTGFEYRDSSDTSQCEIWNAFIGGFKASNEWPYHWCLVKKNHYYDSQPGVCRKHSDKTGMGSNGNEYDLYKFVTYEWCKQKCFKDKDCKGIEYRYWPEDNTQCEIWHYDYKGVENKPFSYCDKKVSI